VVHAPERHRYELRDADKTVGYSVYRLKPNQQAVFTHTQVDDAYSGRGLGAQLAKVALDDARSNGWRILPLCPYISAYLRHHHEYDDIVDPLPQWKPHTQPTVTP
jgi:predicted GNAT family acetyltransferase